MKSMVSLDIAIKDQISADDIVIVAPLYWGLGHATRCIPIIYRLQALCKEVIIASDGAALNVLRKEFPHLQSFELPSYNIRYKYENIVLNMAIQLPKIWKAIRQEEKAAEMISKKTEATVILSDNRLGFRCDRLQNIYLTHQLTILHNSPIVSAIASKCHHHFINKFDVCWVPDFQDEKGLAGRLSLNKHVNNPVYIGPITRIVKEDNPIKTIDIVVILSGPEPQRSILEQRLLSELNKMTHLKVLFVRGSKDRQNMETPLSHIDMMEIVDGKFIQQALNRSKLLISRSGYTTIMDINELDIKAIFIPTPGQTEQEYLAELHSQKLNIRSLAQKDVQSIQEEINKMLETN